MALLAAALVRAFRDVWRCGAPAGPALAPAPAASADDGPVRAAA
jgi:hypothetical protein